MLYSDDGLACNADTLCKVGLGHFIRMEPQGTNVIRNMCLLGHASNAPTVVDQHECHAHDICKCKSAEQYVGDDNSSKLKQNKTQGDNDTSIKKMNTF